MSMTYKQLVFRLTVGTFDVLNALILCTSIANFLDSDNTSMGNVSTMAILWTISVAISLVASVIMVTMNMKNDIEGETKAKSFRKSEATFFMWTLILGGIMLSILWVFRTHSHSVDSIRYGTDPLSQMLYLNWKAINSIVVVFSAIILCSSVNCLYCVNPSKGYTEISMKKRNGSNKV